MRRKVLSLLLAVIFCVIAPALVFSAEATDPYFVTSVNFDTNKHYLPGTVVQVTLKGEANGMASFDVGNEKGLQMSEVAPGIYVGAYRLPKEVIVTDAEVVGHLVKGNRSQTMSAPILLSSGPVSDNVTKLYPDNGSNVVVNPPSIYFIHRNEYEDQRIQYAELPSFHVYYDGTDVTRFSTVTEEYVRFIPTSPISLGAHHLELIGKSLSGLKIQHDMWFTVERALPSTINTTPQTITPQQ